MIVLDASAVIHLLLNTPTGLRVAAEIAPVDQSLHAPQLLDLEVAQVLRRYVLTDELSEERGREALEDFVDLDISRHDHQTLLGRIWSLRDNLTAYDASYVALAEGLEAVLLTTDRALAATSQHDASVRLVEPPPG